MGYIQIIKAAEETRCFQPVAEYTVGYNFNPTIYLQLPWIKQQ